MRKIKLITNAVQVLIIMLCCSYSYAEMDPERLTINDFLATAEKDYSLTNHRELEKYLKTAPASTPFFDKVEFRAGIDQLEDIEQKYSVRLYPKGWGETGYNRLLAQKMKNAIEIEHLQYFNAALKNRYLLILDFFKTTGLINKKKELLTVYEDRINVLKQKGIHNIQFGINDLITAEDKYTKLHLDIVNLENEWTSILFKIKIAAGVSKDIFFDEKNVITVDKIGKLINDMKSDISIGNISLMDRQSKIEITEIKYNLEKAKNKDYLSLIEFSYGVDNKNDFNESVSIELGFKLPGINPDREQVNSKKLRYLQAKLNYEQEKRETSERVLSLSRSLKRLIKQHNILIDRKENSNADISFKTYLKMKGIDPLTLLKLRESILMSDIQLNKVIYQIRYKYINLMNKKGMLSEKPLKNIISSNMETF